MSDRMDDVLAAIDGALDDWTVSGDAMRWQPPGERELPRRPVDRYTIGRQIADQADRYGQVFATVRDGEFDTVLDAPEVSIGPPLSAVPTLAELMGHRTVTVRMNVSVRPIIEAARRAEESVRRLEAALVRIPDSVRERNSHLAMAAEAVNLFRRYYPDHEEVRREQPSDDFRRRALEHQQNRGTGPKPGRRIPPRDLRR